ncbi:MAG: ribosome silencing factor [Treponema sp.]|nr:ribosome silencing factor [Treponema sp.]
MEGMSSETNNQAVNLAGAIGSLLKEHKGQDVSVLDLRGINNWTDFFIIATVSSKTHMDGLERHIKDFCLDGNIEMFGSSRKNTDDQWRLIDLGVVIVHLMTAETRDFYELDRLWRQVPYTNNTGNTDSRGLSG